MWFVVCYDIKDDRRRQKVADLLDDFGDRIQYSIFELPVSVEQIDWIMNRLGRIVEVEEDSVYCFPICSRCRAGLRTQGRATPLQEDEVWIV